MGITHRPGLGFGEIFPGSAESTRRIILLSIEERVFAKAEQCATKSGQLGDKQGERGLQCSHGGRNPGTFHSVRLSLGTKRGVDLSEKTSNFVSKLCPCWDSDCPRAAGGPERREANQSSKSTYLLHTPGSLGSPWPTETEYHCSHSKKITPWLGRWLRGPPKVTERKTQTPSLPIYYLGRPARSLIPHSLRAFFSRPRDPERESALQYRARLSLRDRVCGR